MRSEIDFVSNTKLSSSVMKTNESLNIDLQQFTWVTKPDDENGEDDWIKKADINKMLMQSAKEMRALEYYTKTIVDSDKANWTKLKITTQQQLQAYRAS